MYRLLVFFMLFAFHSNAQLLGGTVVDEGRRILANPSFVQEGTIDGWAIFQLVIDRNGKVTSAKIAETNLKRIAPGVSERPMAIT